MKWSFWLAMFVAFASLGWSSIGMATDTDKLRKARTQIEAKEYRAALQTLNLMSPCNAGCRYAKAIAHSQLEKKLNDRPKTRALALSLIDDPSASPVVRGGAAKLLAWSNDERIRQHTGRRTVRRETGGGYAYSDDICTTDPTLIEAWSQQWAALGVDPADIHVPPALQLCNIGPPIVENETYADRCELADSVAAEADEDDGLTSQTDSRQIDRELGSVDDLWGRQIQDLWDRQTQTTSGPAQIVLESESTVLDCSVFAPPLLSFADAIEVDQRE